MKVELNPWMVPNFVTAKMPPRIKQEGFQEGPKWHVSDVDAATLAELCDKFRAEIFRKAGKHDPASIIIDPNAGGERTACPKGTNDNT